jgi:NADPH-dependent 2,4-dienoyl-CoA reductase/sulfur reductase-like enzyme
MNQHYHYLIVGGGMAADAAVRGIRDVDPDGSIGLIGEDPDPPYKRPWLSKGLWKGESLDRIWLNTAERGVDLRLGRKVEQFELAANRIVDDRGEQYTFDRLLMATGVRPRFLAPPSDRVIAFRSLADFRRLFALSQTGRRFAVIGSGFIGSEIAAALAMAGNDADLVFPETNIGERLFPTGLSHSISDRYRAEGVQLYPRTLVRQVTERADGVIVDLVDLDGEAAGRLEVDAVVTGIGSNPNDELAAEAGMQAENGIVVDRTLRTRRPDVFAAGDVARFFQPALRQYIRVEHEDNARKMGRLAGRAMAGQPEPYDHLPSFYSDLFDMGYEAVGEIDSRLETVEDWLEPNRQGVIYYAREGRVRGVLLWNVWGKTDRARELIGTEALVQNRVLSGELIRA